MSWSAEARASANELRMQRGVTVNQVCKVLHGPRRALCVMERWLPAPGFDGLYEVSDAGRVRRVGKAARRSSTAVTRSSTMTSNTEFEHDGMRLRVRERVSHPTMGDVARCEILQVGLSPPAWLQANLNEDGSIDYAHKVVDQLCAIADAKALGLTIEPFADDINIDAIAGYYGRGRAVRNARRS